MTPSHRAAMEHAIHLDLTSPSRINMAPDLSCLTCGTALPDESFADERGNPICLKCAVKLFGACGVCGYPLNDGWIWDAGTGICRACIENERFAEADHEYRRRIGD
jgi:hypothetical protein